jgi:hypothetical protein
MGMYTHTFYTRTFYTRTFADSVLDTALASPHLKPFR